MSEHKTPKQDFWERVLVVWLLPFLVNIYYIHIYIHEIVSVCMLNICLQQMAAGLEMIFQGTLK